MWCNLRDAKGTCLSRSLARAHLYYVVIITAIYYVCNIIIYNNTITGACICGSSGIPSSLASCVKFTRVVIAHSELISESMSFLFLYDFCSWMRSEKKMHRMFDHFLFRNLIFDIIWYQQWLWLTQNYIIIYIRVSVLLSEWATDWLAEWMKRFCNHRGKITIGNWTSSMLCSIEHLIWIGRWGKGER